MASVTMMEHELGVDGTDEKGYFVRCTPTLRNVKESNAKSKAQLIVQHNNVSKLVITFRTSKAQYSDEQIRAAKIRFMLIFLPHIKGATVSDFCSYYIEYKNYASHGHTRGIDALVAKQHPKLALRGQKHPDLFRTPAGVQKFRNFVQLSLMKLGHAPDWHELEATGASDAGSFTTSVVSGEDDDPWSDLPMGTDPGTGHNPMLHGDSGRSLDSILLRETQQAARTAASSAAGGGGGESAGAGAGAGGAASSAGRRPGRSGSMAESIASSQVAASELSRVKAAISAAKMRTDEAAALVDDMERKLSIGQDAEFGDRAGGGEAPTAGPPRDPRAPLTPTIAPSSRPELINNSSATGDFMNDCLAAMDMVAEQGDVFASLEDPSYHYGAPQYYNQYSGLVQPGPLQPPTAAIGGASAGALRDQPSSRGV